MYISLKSKNKYKKALGQKCLENVVIMYEMRYNTSKGKGFSYYVGNLSLHFEGIFGRNVVFSILVLQMLVL